MFNLIRDHQLNLMLILMGVCAIMTVFVLLAKGLNRRKTLSLALVEFSSMLLLMFDRFAYIYRGDVSRLGYHMVRVSNFFVFALTLVIIFSVDLYIVELLHADYSIKKVHVRLIVSFALAALGLILLVISQFTGLYYTFDEYNRYQRSPGYVICFIIPLVLLVVELSLILDYRKQLRKGIFISLILFSAAPLVAAMIQLFTYGISLTNLTITVTAVILFVFSYTDTNVMQQEKYRQEVDFLKRSESSMSKLFEQTTTALINAIDEGNSHQKEHSLRVAGYARRIASEAGMDSQAQEEVYFCALLHDVGKIALPDDVLGLNRELNEQEEKVFEEHTIEGGLIVAQIKEYAHLSTSVRAHHERYDGLGYPDHLKGDEIPEIARIVAVANAYDEMTSAAPGSRRLPQARVREEFVKGSGTRFDPKYAKIMLKIIGDDADYSLKETAADQSDTLSHIVRCTTYRSSISNGIEITHKLTRIKMNVTKKGDGKYSLPALVLFDSLDGNVHSTEQAIVENSYTEYGELWFDGHSVCTQARVLETRELPADDSNELPEGTYIVEADRVRDHVRIRIKDKEKTTEAIAVLPDSTRYAYIGITGEECDITNIEYEKTDIETPEEDIPRIANEVSYLTRLESDIANIQIDRYRSHSTTGIRVHDGLRLEFHTMSLPTAHLIWHCPYLVLFSSDNHEVGGPNYREYVLIRLDGEVEGDDPGIENKMLITKSDKFDGWDTWNELNKFGFECKFEFKRLGNRITVTTENFGIAIKNTMILDRDLPKDVYAALTGDQVALTDIRIFNG